MSRCLERRVKYRKEKSVGAFAIQTREHGYGEYVDEHGFESADKQDRNGKSQGEANRGYIDLQGGAVVAHVGFQLRGWFWDFVGRSSGFEFFLYGLVERIRFSNRRFFGDFVMNRE